MALPRHFLIEMARKYDLSPEQEATFVLLLGTNKLKLEICQELCISDSSLRSRMTGVYKKFSISGSGPVKERKLLNFLTTESQKYKASVSPTVNLSEDDLKELVQEVREKCREMIQDLCGTMRSLTMSQPIDVAELYTNVNILEKIPSRQRREVDEMVQHCNPENFERFGLGEITDSGIPGLEAVEKYSKLMVLGKPGSGKTTFLKHLAIQCNRGDFQAYRVPIFITLKRFAEAEEKPTLLEYITEYFSNCEVSAEQIGVLLKHGKALVLFDGLDEVKVEDNSRVIKQVRDFSDKFRTNQFVMTCRIAANNYNFEKFTEVEVADFDDEQIKIFAQKWFKTKEPARAEEFIEQLQENDPIRELATNPLLLTLLCLVFEELHKFPANRSELYEEGVDILLKQWDETRNIERGQVYKNISLQRKKDLLSQIALATFEQGDYFFKQKELEEYISDYIRNLPDAQNEPEVLQLDSEAVLKSIEAQHGLLVERAQKIYSFSHLTFQEYFTARKFVERADADWQNLASVSHITDPRWREIFLLIAEMLPNTDELLSLMKQKIDALVAEEDNLKAFLIWIKNKSISVKTPYKLSAIRAFYYALSTTLDAIFPNPSLDAAFPNPYLGFEDFFNSEIAVSLGFDPERDDQKYCDVNLDFKLCSCLVDGHAFIDDRKIELEPDIKNLLLQINSNRPDYYLSFDVDSYQSWWYDNVQQLVEELRYAIIKYRNVGHNWQFNESQKQLLKQYYNANKLLVDCLNISCNVSCEVREDIEQRLFLPTVDI